MNWQCVFQGHLKEKHESDRLVYQKGGVRPVRDYYSGIYMECVRKGCHWNRFIGKPVPYETTVTINGNEIHCERTTRQKLLLVL